MGTERGRMAWGVLIPIGATLLALGVIAVIVFVWVVT